MLKKRLVPKEAIWIKTNINLTLTKFDTDELQKILVNWFNEHLHFQILKDNTYINGDICSYIVGTAYEYKIENDILMFLVSCLDIYKECLIKLKVGVGKVIEDKYCHLTFKYLFFDCGGNR